jgi:hypothetical protein
VVIPRSWKSTDAAAAARDFFLKPRKAAIRELMRELCSPDPFEHRCAAELARLISRREPGILAAWADLLAETAAALPDEEWQARGYVLVAAALNAQSSGKRMRLLPVVRDRLVDERVALRAMALEAFAILGAHEPGLREEAMALLEAARRSPISALRSRARLMLPLVMEAEAEGQSAALLRK